MKGEAAERISDHASIKRKNQLTILRQIREDGPITRVALKQRTRLSWGTVTSSIRELLGKGILTEIGSISTGLGRRPVEIDLNTEKNHVLGMHLGGTLVRSVLVDVKGAVVDHLDLPVDSDGSSREILGRMLKAAREVLKRSAVGPRSLGGIGIAAPGAVDFHAGVCLYAPHHPHWKDVPLKRKFEQEFGVPCFVDHVSNCYALSEKLFGHGKDLDTFICVLLGTGVSAGIVIGGEVYRGAECFSGEFGHTCIDMNGPLCACGNNGCIEAYASGPAIACAALEEGSPSGALLSLAGGDATRITAETLSRAAATGDAMALGVFREMGVHLGVGISNLINVFNPQCIILGGAVSRSSPYFLPSLLETTEKRAWHASAKDVRVSGLERGAERGAAAMVLQQLFTTGWILSRAGGAMP
jgi:predicted NBD/HSP70 family sugar kinase